MPATYREMTTFRRFFQRWRGRLRSRDSSKDPSSSFDPNCDPKTVNRFHHGLLSKHVRRVNITTSELLNSQVCVIKMKIYISMCIQNIRNKSKAPQKHPEFFMRFRRGVCTNPICLLIIYISFSGRTKLRGPTWPRSMKPVRES
jgi:hypothetical protein